jgi:hypothetical protein
MLELPADPTPVPASPAPSPEERRRQMLDELGLMTESDYALLMNVTVKTLRNKPLADLPEHVVHGRERFFRKKSVALHMHTNRAKPKRRKRG